MARAYWDFRDQLSTDEGLLLMGPRIVIPSCHNLIMGRLFVDEDSHYGSSQITELVIWETILSETQINQVFDSSRSIQATAP